MRFVCESCRAQYMINDEKVGPKGVKVRCRKCGYVIHVKRTDGAGGAAAAKGASAPPGDPDDAMATQVMNSPLAAGTDATLDLTSPGAPAADPPTSRVNMNDPAVQAAMESKAAKTAAAKNGAANGAASSAPPSSEKPPASPSDSFLGADEDEIGAVFDSVLAGGSTGPTTLPTGNKDLGTDKGAVEGDRESTKVLDAEMVRKLADESNASSSSNPTLAKVEEVPQQDWYVALNDKQTGPMPLDQLKQHWDTGEVGPDSLCWRAGFSDWIPVSEVKILASVLAPKPAKPIVVAPAAAVSVGMIAPSVVSVPVQSAFSAGGLVTTVQSEMQVPIAASGVPSPSISAQEDTGTWRPSAASALASLVKEETDFLAKPQVKKQEPLPEPMSSGGLLDLPHDEKPAPAPQHHAAETSAPARPAPPPVNPYMANPGATYSAPAVTQYRPPSNRGLIIGLGVGGGVLLICLVGLVVFLALRQPVQPQVVVPPPPTQPAQPTAVAVAPTQPTQPPPTQPTQPTQPPVAVANPDPAQPPTQPTVVASAKNPVTRPSSNPRGTVRATVEKPDRDPPPVAVEKKEPAKSGGGDESFDDLFGDGKKKPVKEETKAEPEKKKLTVYVPPPPGGAGGGDLKDDLQQGDILEVVSGSKAALGKCAEEQRKREPGTTGRLVMKWSIQTSGKVSNVGVVTEEFKGTYMAGCVGGVIKAMTFPRHKKAGEPVQFPFKF